MKEKNAPGVVWPAMTLDPPYHMTKAVPRAPTRSMMGEDNSEYTTSLRAMSTSLRFWPAKALSSRSSLANALTTRMPEKTSWSSTEISAILLWLRRPMARSFLPKKMMGYTATGSTTRATVARKASW